MELQIWSDIACPWCWVGKKHLEMALADFGPDVDIVWRAFELNPEAPATAPEPVDYAQRLAAKYGMGRRDAEGFIDRMTGAGRDAGVEMRFDRIRPCNTFNAHRLLAWAKTSGHRVDLKERLFRAYLNEGRDLNHSDTLRELATDVGLDADGALAVLAGDSFGKEVRMDQALARQLGITGVPFFVFGRGLAASGAQPPSVLLDALQRAHRAGQAEDESSAGSPDGATCGAEGCC
ncbi:MAG: DsbA family oxidoreductase [Acidobacteriota bacterium]